MTRIGRWLLLLTALLWTTACGAEPSVAIERWTLTVDSAEEVPSEPVEVRLPAHLDQYLPRHATGYALRAAVDPGPLRGQALVLVLPHFEGLARLRVDGQLVPDARTTAIEEYRHVGPHVWELPAGAGEDRPLQLVLQVEHRWTQSGWLSTVPRLRPSGRLSAQTQAIVVLNGFGAAATFAGLLLIGTMSLGVFRSAPRLRSYLWFAAQLLSAAYYPLYVSGYSQLLVGPYDGLLVALTLDLALYAAVRFTLIEFGQQEDRARRRRWTAALCVVWLGALVPADPFWLTLVGARLTVAFLATVIGYQLYTGVRLVRRPQRPRGAVLFLLSWVALGLGSAFDGLVWLGLGDPLGGLRTGNLGLGIFALLSSLRLTLEHTHFLGTADHLNHQLARRVEALEAKQGEVEHLNARLRDQMSHRSRQLFAMLSQLPNAGATPQLRLDPGEVINGRYRVMHELGAGGMGVVYAVLRQADEMPLALKVTVQGDAWGLARLAREAEIAMLVDHPNVVTVTDVDIDPRRGFLYMVMEHVDGPSLAEHKQGFGRDADWALDVLWQLASGLAALHAAGVVHRDLKPANVLLVMSKTGSPQVKLTDFGISRTLEPDQAAADVRPEDSDVYMPVVRSGPLDPATRRLLDAELRGQAAEASLAQHSTGERRRRRTPSPTPTDALDESTRELRLEEVKELELWEPSSPLTQAGCIVGTPVFMAPELALDPPLISAAADVFSFGVLAHQLLTGRRPFGEPPVMIVAEGRPLPAELELDLEGVPAELQPTLRACLSLDPESRPSAARVAEVFRELVASRKAQSRPSPIVEVGRHRVRPRDSDAPRRRQHETSPPEPHAA
ncbi:MAG: protein kinase [Myxococcales bacterium]|nr:protein kinase [Myxococcales bacterium]